MLAVPHGHRDLVQNDNVEELAVVATISRFVAVRDSMSVVLEKVSTRFPACAGGPSIHVSYSFLDSPANFHQLTWQTLGENNPKQANSDDLD
jgi:hypothetical protein